MIYLLYEDVHNTISSVLTDFYERYPESSRIFLDGYTPSAEATKKLHSRPLLNDGWLILCPASVRIGVVLAAEAANTNNVIFIKVSNVHSLEQCKASLDGHEYKIIDNHKLDKDFLVYWIHQNCKCSMEDARYLYRRVGGRLQDITTSVQILRMLPSVTRSDINKFTSKSLGIGAHDVVTYLLGMNRSSVHYEDVIKFVYEFRFAYNWLLKTITEELDLYLSIFAFMAEGTLTLENFKSQQGLIENKKIAALSEYRMREIVETFGRVSTEYVFWIKQSVASIDRSIFGLYRLINLLRIV